MKYRVIDDIASMRVIILENGKVATISEADEIDVGDGRRSVIEWYQNRVPLALLMELNDVLRCPFEDLPKYINAIGAIPREVVKQRLLGDLDYGNVLDWMFEWLNEGDMYYEDSTIEYTEEALIEGAMTLMGLSHHGLTRDDSLFSPYL